MERDRSLTGFGFKILPFDASPGMVKSADAKGEMRALNDHVSAL